MSSFVLPIIVGLIVGAPATYFALRQLRMAAATDRRMIEQDRVNAENAVKAKIQEARTEATAQAEKRCDDRIEQKDAELRQRAAEFAEAIADRNYERDRADGLQKFINESRFDRGNG